MASQEVGKTVAGEQAAKNDSDAPVKPIQMIELGDALKPVHDFIERHKREIVVPYWRRRRPFTV